MQPNLKHKSVLSKEGTKFEYDLTNLDPKSTLYDILYEKTSLNLKKENGVLKFDDLTLQDFKDVNLYTINGDTPDDPVRLTRLIELLDLYNLYQVHTEYPLEYLRIKMKEDWYRKNLYSGSQIDHNNPLSNTNWGLLQLNQAVLDSFYYMNNVHFVQPRSLVVYKEIKIPDDDHSDNDSLVSAIDHENAAILISKSKLKTKESDSYIGDYSVKYYHTNIRANLEFYLKDATQVILPKNHTYFNSLTNLSKAEYIRNLIRDNIKHVDSIFLNRDQEFNNSVVREITAKAKLIDQKDREIITNTLNFNPDLGKILDILRMLDYFIDDWNNIVLAGGFISSLLLKNNLNRNKHFYCNTPDYDFFIYGLNEREANNKLAKILTKIVQTASFRENPGDNPDATVKIRRTKNAVTVILSPGITTDWRNEIKIQFILRLYKTKSEILHGFDLNSSGICYDGKDILMTQGCYYSMRNMMNFVDFDRMSPSYEYRLCKYAMRGFSIYIPNFDWSKVKIDKIQASVDQEISYRKAISDYRENRKREEKRERREREREREMKNSVDEEARLRDQQFPVQPLIPQFQPILPFAQIPPNQPFGGQQFPQIGQFIPGPPNFQIFQNQQIFQVPPYQQFIPVNQLPRSPIQPQSIFPQRVSNQLSPTKLRGLDRILYAYFYGGISIRSDYEKLRFSRIEVGGHDILYSKGKIIGYDVILINLATGQPDADLMIKSVFEIPQEILTHNMPDIFNISDIPIQGKIKDHLEIDIKLTWKTINPGEQATGTFHKTVYDDPQLWYRGEFYSN